MAHFIWDNTLPPMNKQDGRTISGPANQALTAVEWNLTAQDLVDIKDIALNAHYHQFQNFPGAPLSGGGFGVLAFFLGQWQSSINGNPFVGVTPPIVANMPSGTGATVLYNGAARRGRFAATLD